MMSSKLSWAIVIGALLPSSVPISAVAVSNAPSSTVDSQAIAEEPLQLAQVILPQETLPPSQRPPEFELPAPLPPPAELEIPDQVTPELPVPVPGEVPETVVVEQFVVSGSSAFSEEELAAVTAPYTNRPITFDELFEVRSEITTLYADAGYITSVAIIPPQALTDGVVTIQVVEGRLEDLVVEGTADLKPVYISSRLEPYTEAPLNVNRLLEGLQILQLDPLVRRVSSELSAGPRPGTSLLTVTIEESKSRTFSLELNNFRSPSVGTFQQIVGLRDNNVLGLGEQAQLVVGRSDGSQSLQVGYRTFVNPRNGTFDFTVGATRGEVIEDGLEILDIESEQFFVEATWRQPLRRTPNLEEAIGVIYTRQQSKASFLGDLLGESVPFPALGADDDGETTVSALRFFYDYTQQDERNVLALRSQFSIGLGDFFGGTILGEPLRDAAGDISNPNPDNQFFSFRTQGQWVTLLAPETLLITRGEVQLASDSLVPVEQIRLGGAFGPRGYRQDRLLTDNGLLATVELRYPLYSNPTQRQLLQLTPFVDVGGGWNTEGPQPDESILASFGLGLLWQQPNLTARVDWGIPINRLDLIGESAQENGLYFSVVFQPTF